MTEPLDPRLIGFQPNLTLAEMKVYAAKFLAPEALEIYIDGLRKAGLPEQ